MILRQCFVLCEPFSDRLSRFEHKNFLRGGQNFVEGSVRPDRQPSFGPPLDSTSIPLGRWPRALRAVDGCIPCKGGGYACPLTNDHVVRDANWLVLLQIQPGLRSLGSFKGGRRAQIGPQRPISAASAVCASVQWLRRARPAQSRRSPSARFGRARLHQDCRASPRKSWSPPAIGRLWFLASCSPPAGPACAHPRSAAIVLTTVVLSRTTSVR